MENLLIIKVELECGISTAFKAFTDNNMLENWLTNEAKVEPFIGGKYELFWEPNNKEINNTKGCIITSFEENKYISFNWKGPEEFQSFMNSANPLTHVIVFFSEEHNKNISKTIIHLFHTGWRNDINWLKAREYFKNAWTNALEGLKKKISMGLIR